jgi:hypothetical protein
VKRLYIDVDDDRNKNRKVMQTDRFFINDDDDGDGQYYYKLHFVTQLQSQYLRKKYTNSDNSTFNDGVSERIFLLLLLIIVQSTLGCVASHE